MLLPLGLLLGLLLALLFVFLLVLLLRLLFAFLVLPFRKILGEAFVRRIQRFVFGLRTVSQSIGLPTICLPINPSERTHRLDEGLRCVLQEFAERTVAFSDASLDIVVFMNFRATIMHIPHLGGTPR